MRNFQKATIVIIVPETIDDEVFLGGLHVIGVEDYLTKVDIGHQHILLKGCVPHVEGLIEDFGADVESNGASESPSDP